MTTKEQEPARAAVSGAVELEAELRAGLDSPDGLWWKVGDRLLRVDPPELVRYLLDTIATLRADNERLTDIEDQMREAWKWLRARDLVDDLDDEWDGFTAVLDHHEAEICEQAERAVARAEAAEAERDTLLAQVGEMRGALEKIKALLPNPTLPITHAIKDIAIAGLDAALTKEPSK